MIQIGRPSIKNYSYKSDYYPETNFLNVELKHRVSAAATFGKQKVEFDNVPFSLNLVRVDKRQRTELQLQTFSKTFQLIDRYNSQAWNRTELFLPLEAIDGLVDALIRVQLHYRGIVKIA
jgi:hypothetical protein